MRIFSYPQHPIGRDAQALGPVHALLIIGSDLRPARRADDAQQAALLVMDLHLMLAAPHSYHEGTVRCHAHPARLIQASNHRAFVVQRPAHPIQAEAAHIVAKHRIQLAIRSEGDAATRSRGMIGQHCSRGQIQHQQIAAGRVHIVAVVTVGDHRDAVMHRDVHKGPDVVHARKRFGRGPAIDLLAAAVPAQTAQHAEVQGIRGRGWVGPRCRIPRQGKGPIPAPHVAAQLVPLQITPGNGGTRLAAGRGQQHLGPWPLGRGPRRQIQAVRVNTVIAQP